MSVAPERVEPRVQISGNVLGSPLAPGFKATFFNHLFSNKVDISISIGWTPKFISHLVLNLGGKRVAIDQALKHDR